MNIEKIRKYIVISFQILIVIAAVWAIIAQAWMNLALCILMFVLDQIPSLLEHRFKFEYPTEFEISVLFFIFLSIFLGEIAAFYRLFWWWDLFLHALYAVIIGDFAFALVYRLNRKNAVRLSSAFVALFSFCFALAIGTLWEIFEFFMDTVFGLNMLKSGLVDTMTDLIFVTLGALAVASIGYLYLIGKVNFFEDYIDDFIKRYPDWFPPKIRRRHLR